MKYIDSGKLKKYIENKRNVVCDGLDWDDMDECQRYAVEYLDDVLSFIDSLQQEQPEGLHFIPLIRLIQKIPFKNWNDTVNNYAKKLRDCLIKEGYLKDANVLQGYISHMNGNNVPMATMDEQEQPEQDITEFEKALDDFGEAYATLVDRDNNPNQGIRINAYHELVQERINEILSLAKEYIKQEQPEVDLEREIKKMLGTDYYKQHIKPSPYVIDVINYTAHYFAEWGAKQARKEE